MCHEPRVPVRGKRNRFNGARYARFEVSFDDRCASSRNEEKKKKKKENGGRFESRSNDAVKVEKVSVSCANRSRMVHARVFERGSVYVSVSCSRKKDNGSSLDSYTGRRVDATFRIEDESHRKIHGTFRPERLTTTTSVAQLPGDTS